jgi:hypothetical protein
MTEVRRERHCNDDDVERGLRALDGAPQRVHASRWPGHLEGLDHAGLYSWWVDDTGAADLSRGLGQRVEAGRTYAGQTGATKWPSGRIGSRTLRGRVGGNHLSGSIRGSTFHRTLAACLLDPFGLEQADAGKLAPAAEKRLSAWMREHLELAVNPFPNRDALGDLEDRVLATLDPPLNLDGMPPTALRTRLTELRRRLTAPKRVQPSDSVSAVSGQSAARAGNRRGGSAKPVTLHEEIAEILRETGSPLTSSELAEAVNRRGRYAKRDGTPVTPFQIHGRTRNYPQLFARNGSTVVLRSPQERG